MAKKIAALMLAILLCLTFVGCSNDGAPDGMFSATVEGEPFILYVPDKWTSNTASGISSAFYSATDKIGVSARYYTPENPQMTLEEYVTLCIENYFSTLELFTLTENKAAVLGGADAKELVYTAEYDSQEYTFRQMLVKYLGDFVVLTFYAPTDMYSDNTAYFDSIADEFVLCEKTVDTGDCVTDKKTPEGMKIASSDVVEYRLYVPNTWVCSSESGTSEAYYPESGKPNVTVSSYSPDETMTAQEYFAECEKQYKDTFSDYTLISSETREVGGRDAVSYTYGATVGDVRVRIMQTVFVYSDLVYSFTYTALEDSFDAHLDDVDAMLDAFIFR